MRWLRIAHPLGVIVAAFGALLCLPALVSWLFQDGMAAVYLACGAGVMGFGGALAWAGLRFRGELRLRHGFLMITLIWTVLPCFAALPLLLVINNLSFAQAYFEAASGLTASGATALSGLDSLPPSINFWRGEMAWIGGMGLVVLATAILPALGIGGSGMFNNELPGPLKDSKITPKIAQTAKALWLIYAALTAVCAAAYYAAGMSGLDAVIHAFTTVGLSGFSTHDASYGHFQSPAIEGVAIFFMLAAGMNFVLHYTAWHGKNWRVYLQSPEWKAYLALVAFCVAAVTLFLLRAGEYDNWQTALRYGAFNAVSIVTTTGYANTDYNAWPLFAPVLMLLMANLTACSGSTGGGIKLIRALILYKQLKTESVKLTHPHAYYDNKVSAPLPQKIVVSTLFFILAYVAFILFLTLFFVATGLDFLTASSAAIATTSNTGPGLGDVGPASNYAHFTAAQTWGGSLAMLFGRLELMSFLVVLQPGFWRY